MNGWGRSKMALTDKLTAIADAIRAMFERYGVKTGGT